MIYAYCRVSTTHQRIARQITNITAIYPSATIIREFYTGTKQDRRRGDQGYHQASDSSGGAACRGYARVFIKQKREDFFPFYYAL
jgi:hypothetical protein